MKSERRPTYDPRALRDLAGDGAFARGEAYFRDGRVDVLGIEPSRIVARVAGTEDYRTVVTGQATAIGGECSCPAFDREGFCKHMVAVALAANAAIASGETYGGGALAQIRDYLTTRDVGALVGMIMDMAERSPALLRKLEISAAMLGAEDKVLVSQMRKAIRDATRTPGFVDYARAAGWAGGVDAALDMLAEVASGPRAALAVEIAVYATSRIVRAIESIDDSDGHCGALLARAQRIHLDACRSARPDPVSLAHELFLRETKGEYDIFHGAAAQYADVLGEAGLAEYRRLAGEAWEKLPARSGTRRSFGGLDLDYTRLSSILDFFAECDGDVDMRVAPRAKNLSSPWDYLQLAEFCRAHGREEEALRRAEEGLWLFEDDRPDERLVSLGVDLLLKADRKADAEAYLWRAFEKVPSPSLYHRLRKLGGAAAAARVVKFLEARLVREPSTRWSSPADLLIHVMMEEKLFEDAWTAVRDYGASRVVKEALARASETTHASQALAVYAERVEDLVNSGGNPNYEQAVALIARMATLRDPTEQEAYLSDVRMRHGRKRNFMKLLG